MYAHETLFHDQLRACLNNSTAPNNTGPNNNTEYYAEETGTPQRNSDGTISVFYTVTPHEYPINSNRVCNLALHVQCILKHDPSNHTTFNTTDNTDNYIDSTTAAAIYNDQLTATYADLRLHLIDLSTQSIICRVPPPAYGPNKSVTPEELARDIQRAFTRR